MRERDRQGRRRRACGQLGWRAVVFSTWRLDWNEWRDLDVAVRHVAGRYPKAPLFAVAHSAGAFILVQYLAAVGANTPVVAAATVAGCFDFVRTFAFVAAKCKRGGGASPVARTYRNFFYRGMRRCVRAHVAHDRHFALSAAARERHRDVLRIRDASLAYDRHIALLPRATAIPLNIHSNTF